MNTLIVNLTRFGDLLQTQPVVAGLKARGDEVGFVCLENFAQTALFLQGTDRIYPFPGAGLLADLDRAWPAALHRLQAWREQVRTSQRGDAALLNLTPTQGARLLARVLSQGEAEKAVAGFGMDGQGFGVYDNTWAAFLQMSSTHRGCSPFNLVDVMLRGSGLPVGARCLALKRPNQDHLEQALHLLQARAPSDCKGYVGFQLGASEKRRQWPEEYFARLGTMLWDRLRLCPVLLGTQSERVLTRRYSQHASAPWIDLAGQTSLPQLAAILCHLRLLVTNDTGTMHLAAGLDRPIVAIFLATAQPWDTGPYREGCLCLEPDLECHPCSFGQACAHDEACRRAISAEAVCDLLLERFFPDIAPRDSSGTFGTKVRIWLTDWDGLGYMNLNALSGQEDSVRTQWIRIQRHYYRQFLDLEGEIQSFESSRVLPHDVAQRIVFSLEQSQALLQLLDSQARVLATASLDKVKRKFLAYWERLQSHWQADPFFSVLGRLWLVESQDSGRDLRGIQDLTGRYLELIRSWRRMFS
ncbi:MAG TPA: glycosyltransferase family 9 protein [Desulfonatronum sp.]|nr:glycosyltransferase family 9 protein [Desulfonatronum sp.]